MADNPRPVPTGLVAWPAVMLLFWKGGILEEEISLLYQYLDESSHAPTCKSAEERASHTEATNSVLGEYVCF